MDVVSSSNVVPQEQGIEEMSRDEEGQEHAECINAVGLDSKKNKSLKDEEITNNELWDIERIKLLQRKDHICKLIRKHIAGTLSEDEKMTLRRTIHEFKTMEFIKLDDVIYKTVRSVRNKFRVRHAIYTPEPMRNISIKMAHEDRMNKHVGTRRTRERLEEFAYWPTKNADIEQFVKSCEICTNKNPQDIILPKLRFRGRLHTWDRVHMNIIKLDKSEKGPMYVMT